MTSSGGVMSNAGFATGTPLGAIRLPRIFDDLVGRALLYGHLVVRPLQVEAGRGGGRVEGDARAASRGPLPGTSRSC